MGVVKGFDELDGSRRKAKAGALDIEDIKERNELIKKAFNLSHGKGKRKRKKKGR